MNNYPLTILSWSRNLNSTENNTENFIPLFVEEFTIDNDMHLEKIDTKITENPITKDFLNKNFKNVSNLFCTINMENQRRFLLVSIIFKKY